VRPLIRGKNRLLFLLLVLSTGAVTGSAHARSINDAIGKTSFAWLKAVSDAELSASGECLAARDGKAGLLVHPAAVAGIRGGAAKLSYVAHYVDTQFGCIGYAGRIRGRDVGLRVTYVNYGEFVRTNKQGERVGTFTAGDMGFSLNIGRKLREDLKAGITFSFLTSKIEDFTARAATVDVGVIYHPPFEGLTVGAVLMNMGRVTKSYSSGYREALPVVLSVGGRKKLAHAPITLMADVLFPNDNDIAYAFGVELSIHEAFSVYAGTKSRTDVDTEIMKAETDYSGITAFGFGLSLKGYRFNYAFCPDDALENTHKFTFFCEL